MSTKKAVLVFPDGVGIRNYLYSDVFKNIDADLIVLHDFDDDTAKLLSAITSIKRFYKIPKYKESLKEKFFRELISLCRLKYNASKTGNPTIVGNWNTNHKTFSKKLFYYLIEQISNFVKDYNAILKLEKTYQRSLRNTYFYKQIDALFAELNPDLVFCAHQRGLQCAPIFAVAEDRNIVSNTVIFSWDNLSKARMALKADRYLVWSNFMKNEVNVFYPEISSEKIIVTGTPQFEFYTREENIIDKKEFYKRYNLDVNKKIVCFSGDDTKTSPDDPKYLFDLASEIIKNNLDKEYQILFRRCPVDLSGRYDKIVSQFPDLIKEATPIWNITSSKRWSTIFALPEDIALLVSTVYYSHVVVNVGSTMAFDFAMFKKPCIFIAYDQDEKTDEDWSVEKIYNFEHFKSMPNASAVIWWRSKSAISQLIVNAAYNSSTDIWKNIILGEIDQVSPQITKALNL